MNPDDLHTNIGTNLIGNLEITDNLKQEVVMTTRDKIKVALHEMLPAYSSTGELLAWLSLTAGLLVALVTADFKDVLGVPGDAITGAFVLATVAAGAWTVREFVRWCSRPTLDQVAERIIKDSTRPARDTD
ncbi:MAG: hypothetical protein Q4F65_05595 [Propionibacteriaceae bacterium]|nr:hypothetical protein [Propionibacteriaceae bacterium]